MRKRKVPLWVVVIIILIGLFASPEHTALPLTASVAAAGLIVSVFSQGVDRVFGIALLIVGLVLTAHEYNKLQKRDIRTEESSSPARMSTAYIGLTGEKQGKIARENSATALRADG